MEVKEFKKHIRHALRNATNGEDAALKIYAPRLCSVLAQKDPRFDIDDERGTLVENIDDTSYLVMTTAALRGAAFWLHQFFQWAIKDMWERQKHTGKKEHPENYSGDYFLTVLVYGNDYKITPEGKSRSCWIDFSLADHVVGINVIQELKTVRGDIEFNTDSFSLSETAISKREAQEFLNEAERLRKGA